MVVLFYFTGFISFRKYILNNFYMPKSVLGTDVGYKDTVFVFQETSLLVRQLVIS